MAENLYWMSNGFSAVSLLTVSTAGATPASTGAFGKWSAMLQLASPSTRQINIVEYGISLSGAPAGASLMLAATGTAATVANTGVILPYSNPGAPGSLLTTASCGYFTATTGVAPFQGTVSELYDIQLLTTNTYVKQFPNSREPVVPVSSFVQIGVNIPTAAVTGFCYIVWRE